MNRKQIMAALLMAGMPAGATAQKLETAEKEIDCGEVLYNRPETAVFKLKNKGHRKLRIDDVELSCGCIAADYPDKEIEAGAKFELKITYDAKMLGRFEKTAIIRSNGSKEPVTLTMKGVVVDELHNYEKDFPYEFGQIRADRNELEFDDLNKGAVATQEIFIVNTGTTAAMPNLMHLPSYLTAFATPEKLMPKRTGKIVVSLNSSKLYDYGLTQSSVYLASQPGEKVSDEKEIRVSTVMLPSFNGMTEAQKKFAPKMKLSATTLDINFEGKKKRSGTIEITNNGRTTLNITSLQMFTAGLSITLGKSKIEPGETTKLKITAVREELKKLRKKPRVLMITDDPDMPKVTITVNAK